MRATDRRRRLRDQLGVRRAFLNTPETAKDLENLRVALGVDKLTLFGVSYGAQVAAEYARRFPDATAAVVLDSPTPVDGLDGVDQLRTFGARACCARSASPGVCHRTVTDPDEALAARGRAARRGAVAARVPPSGASATRSATESPLRALTASDVTRACAPALPAAIASLAAGDAAPLLHLGALDVRRRRAADINTARLLATVCIEGRLPWAPDSPVAPRAGGAGGLHRRARGGVRAVQRADACSQTRSPSSARPGRRRRSPRPCPTPARTCRCSSSPAARTCARRWRAPAGPRRSTRTRRLLAVPGVGHSVLSTDLTGCAVTGLVAFLRGQTVASARARRRGRSRPYAPATSARCARRGSPACPAGRSARSPSRSPASGSTPRARATTRSSFPGCAPATCGPADRARRCTASSGSGACASPAGSTRAAAGP